MGHPAPLLRHLDSPPQLKYPYTIFPATRRVRLAATLAALVAGGATIAVFLSQSAGAVATPLAAAQPYLSEYDHTQYTVLPVTTAVATTQLAAEAVALNQFGYPNTAVSSVSATLVSATVDGYCNEQADGTCPNIISNRPVWIVILPNQQVPLSSAPGHAASITGSIAVLVDANSGAYLMADVIPAS